MIYDTHIFRIGDIVKFIDCPGDDQHKLDSLVDLRYARHDFKGKKLTEYKVIAIYKNNENTIQLKGRDGTWYNANQFMLANCDNDQYEDWEG